MATLLKKLPDGRVMALKQGRSEFTVLSDQIIPIAGMDMRVAHVVQWGGTPQVWYIFDRLTMLLQVSDFDDGSLYFRKGETGQKKIRVFHDEVHFLNAKLISESGVQQPIVHYDSQGGILGGSNVHSGGPLCLGQSWSPFNLSPVELFCNGRPNQDLTWQGPRIPYKKLDRKWTSQTNKIYETYQITSWPPISSHRLQIPPQLLGYFGP